MKNYLEYIKESQTPNYMLFNALLRSDVTSLEYSIDKGADINRACFGGKMTPLLFCIFHAKNDCAKILINAGADLNKADEQGYTPLILSAYTDNVEMVKLLLTYKSVDVTIKTNDGMSFVSIHHDDLIDYYKRYDFQKKLLDRNESNIMMLPKNYWTSKIKDEYPHLFIAKDLNLL